MADGEPEAYKEQDLRSIGVSPRERLERIENLLTRMDEKLDNKADASVVTSLITRISALELSEALGNQTAATLALDVRDKLDVRVSALQKEHQKLDKKLTYYAGGVAALLAAAPFVWQYIIK